MGLYDFQIVDKDGNLIASLSGARQRSFATYLNKTGDAQFVLSPTDSILQPDTLLLGHKELRVWRANKLDWGGELVYARTDLSRDDERIEVSAKGYLAYLGQRFLGMADEPTNLSGDIAAIARDLVQETQVTTNGSIGITLGANPGVTRQAERSNVQYKSVKEVIEGLSNENVDQGIDYEITPDKVFNVFYPQKGRTLAEVVFEWGVNIASCYEIRDATELANQAIVLGSGEGSSMLTSTRNSATSLQEIYRLRQTVLSHKNVVEVPTLESHGDQELAAHQLPTQIVGVTVKGDAAPAFGSYSVGDSVRVKIKRGLLDIDGYYRIYGIAVTITDTDEETINLIFNKT